MPPLPESDALLRLRERCARVAGLLGSPIPFHTTPQHDGSSHVEEQGGVFSYVVTERGQELQRRVARDADEMAYWLVADEVFALACRHELAHRRPGEDSRRLLFAHELALLGRVDRAWADRRRGEIEAVLEQDPYSA